MKVSKAIQLFRDPLLFSTHPLDQDARDAIALAIESLERHNNRDYITYSGMYEPLPSETPPTP